MGTVFLVFDAECLLSVMTLAAEIALGDHFHVHLVRSHGHLEYLVMATRALQAVFADVFFVTEHDRQRAPGRERQVSAADLLRECTG